MLTSNIEISRLHQPFILCCDASGHSLGVVLAHMQEGKEIVIAYASRALTVHEKKFATIEREILALVYGLKRFRHYLYGNEIFINNDHHPLKTIH